MTKHKQFKHWTVQSVDPQPEPVSDKDRIEALEREVEGLRLELAALLGVPAKSPPINDWPPLLPIYKVPEPEYLPGYPVITCRAKIVQDVMSPDYVFATNGTQQ